MRTSNIANEMEVMCWCERMRVFVSRTKILDGQTASCGLSTCKEPEKEKK